MKNLGINWTKDVRHLCPGNEKTARRGKLFAAWKTRYCQEGNSPHVIYSFSAALVKPQQASSVGLDKLGLKSVRKCREPRAPQTLKNKTGGRDCDFRVAVQGGAAQRRPPPGLRRHPPPVLLLDVASPLPATNPCCPPSPARASLTPLHNRDTWATLSGLHAGLHKRLQHKRPIRRPSSHGSPSIDGAAWAGVGFSPLSPKSPPFAATAGHGYTDGGTQAWQSGAAVSGTPAAAPSFRAGDGLREPARSASGPPSLLGAAGAPGDVQGPQSAHVCR